MSIPHFDFKNQRILICQPIMHAYCGSTVCAIEMAEYLLSQKAKVEIYTLTYASPIREECEQRKIKVHTFADQPDLKLKDYTFVWVCSQVLPVSIVKELKTLSEGRSDIPRFIFAHLSSLDIIPDEFPWIYNFEDKLADQILYMCEEAEVAHAGMLNAKIPSKIFRNPAPTDFLRKEVESSKKLSRVLVVSNHVPPELAEAESQLKERGVTVEHLGAGGKYHLTSPEDIFAYDAVISIGKTVQYSLLAQVPVYVYDHYGGPGYINSDNYDKAKFHNFSGRGFKKKSTGEIIQELFSGYSTVLAAQNQAIATDLPEYKIDESLPVIFSQVTSRKKGNFSQKQVFSIYYAQLFCELRFREILLRTQDAATCANLRGEIESLRSTIAKQEHDLQDFERIQGLKGAIKHLFKTGKNFTAKNIKRLTGRTHKKLYLVITVKNEEYYLPSFLQHVQKYVDGIVALDDGSSDGTVKILENCRKVKQFIRRPAHKSLDWDERGNREAAILAAKKLGADWVLCADPDERFEIGFLKHLRELICSERCCYRIRFRELHDNVSTYRSDGIWGEKTKDVLFPLSENMDFDYGRNHHFSWAYKEILDNVCELNYDMYHLKMIKPSDRQARARLYNKLDPQKQMQAIGYDYLTDETGMKLTTVDEVNHPYDTNCIPEDLKSQ